MTGRGVHLDEFSARRARRGERQTLSEDLASADAGARKAARHRGKDKARSASHLEKGLKRIAIGFERPQNEPVAATNQKFLSSSAASGAKCSALNPSAERQASGAQL